MDREEAEIMSETVVSVANAAATEKDPLEMLKKEIQDVLRVCGKRIPEKRIKCDQWGSKRSPIF